MLKDIISSNLDSRGYIYGLANLTGLLDDKFLDYPVGLSIGKKLDNKIMDVIENGPTKEYLDCYHQTNIELFETAIRIQNQLKHYNINSIVIPPSGFSKSKEFPLDNNVLKAIISHKMVATRAGLGWIGKTDLFVSKKFGPRLRLTSLLINHPLIIDSKPVEKSRCGKCNVCVEKCPAGAANGKLWNINVYRDEFFNAFKCRDKCKELTFQRLNLNETICGICVSVCPIGKK